MPKSPEEKIEDNQKEVEDEAVEVRRKLFFEKLAWEEKESAKESLEQDGMKMADQESSRMRVELPETQVKTEQIKEEPMSDVEMEETAQEPETESAAVSKNVTQPVDSDALFKEKLEEQAKAEAAMREARAEEADSENEEDELPATEAPKEDPLAKNFKIQHLRPVCVHQPFDPRKVKPWSEWEKELKVKEAEDRPKILEKVQYLSPAEQVQRNGYPTKDEQDEDEEGSGSELDDKPRRGRGKGKGRGRGKGKGRGGRGKKAEKKAGEENEVDKRRGDTPEDPKTSKSEMAKEANNTAEPGDVAANAVEGPGEKMPEENRQRPKKVSKKSLKRQRSKKVEEESKETAKTGKRCKKVKKVETEPEEIAAGTGPKEVEDRHSQTAGENSCSAKKVKHVKKAEGEYNCKRRKTKMPEPVDDSKAEAEEGSREVGKEPDRPEKTRKKRGKTAEDSKSNSKMSNSDTSVTKSKKSRKSKKSPESKSGSKKSPQNKRKDPELAAKASRKSSAYHCAKRKARKEGRFAMPGSEGWALRFGGSDSRLFNGNVVDQCASDSLVIYIVLSEVEEAAYRVRFWMQLLGHGSPKPTVAVPEDVREAYNMDVAASSAPAIAKSSGAYVPGVPLTNLGSMGPKSLDKLNAEGTEGSKRDVDGSDGHGSLNRTNTDTSSSDLKTPPIDSQWRLEASPPAGVKKPSQHLPDPTPDPPQEMPEIPAGYSPSSRKSSATPSESKYDKYYHACHRYCKPRKGGVSKASKGEKLQKLLREHGNFKMVELKIARWSQTVHSTNVGGRWCTKKYLAEVEHYTKDMIDNSFNHAKAKGKAFFRINPVHGEEEAKLVLADAFNNKNEKGETTNLSSHGTFEDSGLD
eukprot:s1158_g7.t1